MDAIEGALKLLDLLERDQLAALDACARALRASRVELREDGLELLERAIALDRPEAVRLLLHLGISGRTDVLFGAWCHGALTRLAERCLALGRIPILLELLACGATLPALRHDDDLVDRIARAAIVESALDDQGIATIARACGTHHGAFLLHALQQGRLATVQHLAAICTRSQNFGASSLADVPLVAAAEAGATSVLAALVTAGAKPNVRLRDHGYPLHNAVVCRRLAPLPRSELVHELLRLGAVPELRDSKGRDAYALAEAQGDVEVIDVLRRHGLAYGPRQSREARALGVRDICLLYDKADGLIYRIGQPDVPFLVGGDYDGPGPCPIESFRVHFERVRHRRSEAPLAWFEPFLDRIERGQEFGYQELIASAPDLRIVRFDQNSNWSQMVD